MTAAEDESRHRGMPAGLLRNTNFLLLWCAYAVSAMGDHLSEMAILKTQHALDPDVDITPLTARMTFVFFVPFFLLAPVTGALADRLPRRGLMIAADAARFAIMLGFATLIAWTQPWGPWGPFLPLLLVGMFAALFSPARAALLPTIIRRDQLVRANGLIAGLGIIATMAAAVVSGYLADNYKPAVAFRIDAATFLVSAIILTFIAAPRGHAATTDHRGITDGLRDIRAGFRYVRAHRHIVELVAIAALVWFCGPLVNSVIPAVVRDVYGGSYQLMSSFRAFLGGGFVVGAIIMALLGDALRSEIALTWGLCGIGVGIAVFALSVFLSLEPGTLQIIGAVGISVAGLFAVTVMASFNALLQRTVADRYRGRVFGVKDLCTMAALLVATGALGVPRWARVDRWVGVILGAVAVVTFGAGVVTLNVRLHRGPHGKGFNLLENLNEFLAKSWWGLRRVGRSTVPRSGPVIIAANHTCAADPAFLSAAVPYRLISFLVAAEYMNLPIVRHLMRSLHCIPVKRDGRDTAATKHAIRHLREGKAVGVFIEGRIVPPGEKGRPKDGVALLALKTSVPVIPAHISGVQYHDSVFRGLLARHRARVRFGPAVDLSEFDDIESGRERTRAATTKIYAAIQALAPDGHDGTSR